MKKILTSAALLSLGAFAATAQNQNCNLHLELVSPASQSVVEKGCDDDITVTYKITNLGPDDLVVDTANNSLAVIHSMSEIAWSDEHQQEVVYLSTFKPAPITANTQVLQTSMTSQVKNLYGVYDENGQNYRNFKVDREETETSGRIMFFLNIRGVGGPGPNGLFEEAGYVVDADSVNDFDYFFIDFTCPLSVKEINANTSALKVYPNPTINGAANFDFQFNANETATIRVYDVTGRTVLTQEVKGSGLQTVQVDVTSLNAGMYNMEIATADRRGVSKFTVSK